MSTENPDQPRPEVPVGPAVTPSSVAGSPTAGAARGSGAAPTHPVVQGTTRVGSTLGFIQRNSWLRIAILLLAAVGTGLFLVRHRRAVPETPTVEQAPPPSAEAAPPQPAVAPPEDQAVTTPSPAAAPDPVTPAESAAAGQSAGLGGGSDPPATTFQAHHKHSFGRRCEGTASFTADEFVYNSTQHPFRILRTDVVRADGAGLKTQRGKDWHFDFADKDESEVHNLFVAWIAGRPLTSP